jgi:hypothetical protein
MGRPCSPASAGHEPAGAGEAFVSGFDDAEEAEDPPEESPDELDPPDPESPDPFALEPALAEPEASDRESVR